MSLCLCYQGEYLVEKFHCMSYFLRFTWEGAHLRPAPSPSLWSKSHVFWLTLLNHLNYNQPLYLHKRWHIKKNYKVSMTWSWMFSILLHECCVSRQTLQTLRQESNNIWENRPLFCLVSPALGYNVKPRIWKKLQKASSARQNLVKKCKHHDQGLPDSVFCLLLVYNTINTLQNIVSKKRNSKSYYRLTTLFL